MSEEHAAMGRAQCARPGGCGDATKAASERGVRRLGDCAEDEWLTVADVVKLTKFSQNTIYGMLQRGELPRRKIRGRWRVRRSELTDWWLGRAEGGEMQCPSHGG